MHRFGQLHRVKKGPERADDFEPPSRPIISLDADLRPQLLDGEESLCLGTVKISDLDPCVVENLVMTAQEVEEATHIGPPTPMERMKTANGFCRRSEETLRSLSLFAFRSSLASYGIKAVQ